jgi:predicted nucleic acid-binding protein
MVVMQTHQSCRRRQSQRRGRVWRFRTSEDLVIPRHEHRPLVRRVWGLRTSLAAYDAVYVALAEALAAPLLTCDAKRARAHRYKAKIELVGNDS